MKDWSLIIMFYQGIFLCSPKNLGKHIVGDHFEQHWEVPAHFACPGRNLAMGGGILK